MTRRARLRAQQHLIAEASHTDRPVRTCLGCRNRVPKSDLLRVVAQRAEPDRTIVWLVPDPLGRLPGRGAYVHCDQACYELAQRRRSFLRALRLTDAVDDSLLRELIKASAKQDQHDQHEQ